MVKKLICEAGLESAGRASIRQIKSLIDQIEFKSGEQFIRMEMGIPTISPPNFALEAEIDAIRRGVCAIYPDVDGIPELKYEASRFIKNFINVELSQRSCIPTAGSLNAGYAAFMVSGRRDARKDTILFLDLGFPVHKQCTKMLGLKQQSFDVYDFREEKLRYKLESYFENGNISSIVYSNPNNPTWICLSESELQIIGEVARKYDVIVIEDLAYFGMDFRIDISKPGIPPFQSSIANYSDDYILLISSSKAFGYAGQRVGIMAISDSLYSKKYPYLKEYFPFDGFGEAVVYGCIYATSAGIAHSAQHGLTAILKAINDGEFNFVERLKEYGDRASSMKRMFIDNGFDIVYQKDGAAGSIADGFYFTISYPGMTGEKLVEELLYYGISAVSLINTGSKRSEGIRACVSMVTHDLLPVLKNRLVLFGNQQRSKN